MDGNKQPKKYDRACLMYIQTININYQSHTIYIPTSFTNAKTNLDTFFYFLFFKSGKIKEMSNQTDFTIHSKILIHSFSFESNKYYFLQILAVKIYCRLTFVLRWDIFDL